MRKYTVPVSMSVEYFLTDHLGSVVAITDDEGNLISQQRYLPFGGVRSDVNDITQTDYGYTGQRNLDSDIGLMDYKARFYSPLLNRFIQPDSIVPHPFNSQSYNRYSYVYNNPIIYTDPSGHAICLDGIYCGTPTNSSYQNYVGNGGSNSSGGGGNAPERIDPNNLTSAGQAGYSTYLTLWDYSEGWWWSDTNLGGDGVFSIEDFLSLILYLELDNWSGDSYLSGAWSEAVVRSFYSWKQAMDGLKKQGKIPNNIATDPSNNAALLNFVMRYTGKDTRTKPGDFVYKLYSPTSMAIPKVLGTINAMRSPTNGWGDGCVGNTPCRVGSNSSGDGPKLSYAQAYVNAGCPHYGNAFLGTCGNPKYNDFAFIMTANQASVFDP